MCSPGLPRATAQGSATPTARPVPRPPNRRHALAEPSSAGAYSPGNVLARSAARHRAVQRNPDRQACDQATEPTPRTRRAVLAGAYSPGNVLARPAARTAQGSATLTARPVPRPPNRRHALAEPSSDGAYSPGNVLARPAARHRAGQHNSDCQASDQAAEQTSRTRQAVLRWRLFPGECGGQGPTRRPTLLARRRLRRVGRDPPAVALRRPGHASCTFVSDFHSAERFQGTIAPSPPPGPSRRSHAQTARTRPAALFPGECSRGARCDRRASADTGTRPCGTSIPRGIASCLRATPPANSPGNLGQFIAAVLLVSK